MCGRRPSRRRGLPSSTCGHRRPGPCLSASPWRRSGPVPGRKGGQSARSPAARIPRRLCRAGLRTSVALPLSFLQYPRVIPWEDWVVPFMLSDGASNRRPAIRSLCIVIWNISKIAAQPVQQRRRRIDSQISQCGIMFPLSKARFYHEDTRTAAPGWVEKQNIPLPAVTSGRGEERIRSRDLLSEPPRSA